MRTSGWQRKWVGLTLLLAAALGSPPAGAQSDQEIALARQWFKDADAAEKKRDYETALGLYKKAASVKETPQLLLRVGGCQEKLGDFVGALLSYERALEKAGAAGAEKAKVEDAAKEVIESVRGRIATLTVSTKESYKDLTVKLDGAPLAAATVGDKLPLNPGPHTVVAESPGYKPFQEDFKVAARETKNVAIELLVDPNAPATTPGPASTAKGGATPDQPPPDTGGSKTLPIVLLVGGGAAVAGGVVLLVLALSKDSSIDDLCGGSDRLACPKSKQDQIDSDISTVKTFQILSGAIGGAGLVAAGVGAALLITAKPAPAKTGAVQIVPAAPGGMLGLSARGTF